MSSYNTGYDPIERAEQEVSSTYGDRVSTLAKRKSLLKFGRNANLGTSAATVWQQGGNETYCTTNAITNFSSSSGSDSGSMLVEGHTVSGTGSDAQYTFVTQTVTLNGTSTENLTTPLARVSRVKNLSSTEWVGAIYIYESDTTTTPGVPDTASKIHMKLIAGEQQSYKAATTFSNTDYYLCTSMAFSVNKKTAATVDFELQVRQPGQVFLPVKRLTLNSTGQNAIKVYFDPYLIIPKNSDVRVVAAASTTAVEVSADFQGHIALVIG